MNKRLFLALVLVMILFMPFSVHAKLTEPEIEWSKSLGGSGSDTAASIKETRDGGYIVAGTTTSNDGDVQGNHGLYDYWVVKLNGIGGIEWSKTLGGSRNDNAQDIQQTRDGGYIVAGTSNSLDGDVIVSHNRSSSISGDYWIVKLNSEGGIEWSKCFGGSAYDYLSSIQETYDGGYIASGYTNSQDGDVNIRTFPFDYWIVKMDKYGELEWSRTAGDGYFEQSNVVKQTYEGGYIIAGGCYTDTSTNFFSYDFEIVKLDKNHEIEWSKFLAGSGDDVAKDIEQTRETGYIVVGNSYSNDGDFTGNFGKSDCWIVKMDSRGVVDWKKNLGGSESDNASGVELTKGTGYIVFGGSGSNNGDVGGNFGETDSWIVRLDDSGKIEWEKNLGGSKSDSARDLKVTNDGGFIIAGNSTSNDGDVGQNHGDVDYWIVKLMPDN